MKVFKTIRFTLLLCITVLPGAALHCFAETADGQTSMNEVKKETQELIRTLKSHTADQRDEAVQETEGPLKNRTSASMPRETISTAIGIKWMHRPVNRHGKA